MILRRRVALDGIELDSVDSRILIQGIEPAAGKDQITAVILWGGTGSRVTAEHRDSLDIVVRFTINEKSYRPAERGEVLEKVCAWAAAGGWMTVNYKPDRRIRVICAQMPSGPTGCPAGSRKTPRRCGSRGQRAGSGTSARPGTAPA